MARVEGPLPEADFVPNDLRGLYRSAYYPNVYIGTDASHFGVHHCFSEWRKFTEPSVILTVNPVVLDELTFEQAVAHDLGADVDLSATVLEDFTTSTFVVIRETWAMRPWDGPKKQVIAKSAYRLMKLDRVGSSFPQIVGTSEYFEFCRGCLDYYEAVVASEALHIAPTVKIQMWNLDLDRTNFFQSNP